MYEPGSLTTTPRKYLKVTTILFTAIVTGIVLLMLAALLINQSSGPLLPQFNSYKTVLTGVAAAVSMIGLLLGRRIFHRGITAAKNSLKPLTGKLNAHRSSLIKCLAIVETGVILNIVLFLFTGNFVFLVFGAMLLGFILSLAPIPSRVVVQLDLDGMQQKELE